LAGLGLMNRDSTAFFLLAVGVGLLLSPERRELRKPGPWLAFALALLIFLPNLWWQFRHDFPTLEDLRNVARIGKNVVLGPAAFLGQQVLIIHPVLLPVWLTGLAYLVIARRG
jgi:4-amino-4-deoxy-L-arabinose transferase-like glycosyltransferase